MKEDYKDHNRKHKSNTFNPDILGYDSSKFRSSFYNDNHAKNSLKSYLQHNTSDRSNIDSSQYPTRHSFHCNQSSNKRIINYKNLLNNQNDNPRPSHRYNKAYNEPPNAFEYHSKRQCNYRTPLDSHSSDVFKPMNLYGQQVAQNNAFEFIIDPRSRNKSPSQNEGKHNSPYILKSEDKKLYEISRASSNPFNTNREHNYSLIPLDYQVKNNFTKPNEVPYKNTIESHNINESISNYNNLHPRTQNIESYTLSSSQLSASRRKVNSLQLTPIEKNIKFSRHDHPNFLDDNLVFPVSETFRKNNYNNFFQNVREQKHESASAQNTDYDLNKLKTLEPINPSEFILDIHGTDDFKSTESPFTNFSSATLILSPDSLENNEIKQAIICGSQMLENLLDMRNLLSNVNTRLPLNSLENPIQPLKNLYLEDNKNISSASLISENNLETSILDSLYKLQLSSKDSWCPLIRRLAFPKSVSTIELSENLNLMYFEESVKQLTEFVTSISDKVISNQKLKYNKFLIDCWNRGKRICFFCGFKSCQRPTNSRIGCQWIRCFKCGGTGHGDYNRQKKPCPYSSSGYSFIESILIDYQKNRLITPFKYPLSNLIKQSIYHSEAQSLPNSPPVLQGQKSLPHRCLELPPNTVSKFCKNFDKRFEWIGDEF